MRHIKFIAIAVVSFTVVQNSTAFDDVPTVDVDRQHLVSNLKAVAHAEHEVSGRLPVGIVSVFSEADVEKMQQKVDSQVFAVITINPESRVKAQRGPQKVICQSGWPAPLLVKVINEGGVTARLNATITGEPLCKAHWYEDSIAIENAAILSCKLSGKPVEYQLLVFLSQATGKREVQFTFDVGQATQDLGFRAELALLVSHQPDPKQPVRYSDKQHLLKRTKPATTTIAEWEKQAQIIRFNFQSVAGVIPEQDKTLPVVKVLSESAMGTITSRNITFNTRDGDKVPAIVLMPSKRVGKMPAILCLHQTTRFGKSEPAGLEGLSNLHYARELAERGYVTLSPDYPGFGNNKINPYQFGYASKTAKGIVNHRRAIDVLTAMPEVDAKLIGCMGHSLGGHNTLFVALFDERIKALATSCGFCSFTKYYNGNLKGWSHQGYMPRIASVYQCDPFQMPFDFTEVLAVLAPRPVFINAPLRDSNFSVDGVRECIIAAKPIYGLYGREDRLSVAHPDSEHDFPEKIRAQCYEFFDRYLKKQ